MKRPAFFAALLAVAVLAAQAPAEAGGYTTISGSGSSYAAIALDQWANDIASNGLTVNYNPDGSASGRADYMNGSQVDFAGSDPPFRDGTDELGDTAAENPNYGYSYIPDVAGGLAFIYHITVGGKLVTNLRLSGQVLMEIFTGQISNWDDPRITKVYGTQLPNEQITPVIRSDGSGESYFFSRWLDHVFPSQWDAFCSRVKRGIKQPCPQTEFYPQFGNAKSINGANNITTYVTSSYGEGSIGYVEYGYALNAKYPVVALENAAGYDVLPTASNVAVALTKAVINEDQGSKNYLQQDLDSVYSFTDPRSYPLSSYSYLIVPRKSTTLPPIFSSSTGRSLSAFINYYLCSGQQEAPAMGYSPLPINLVTGAAHQVNEIPGTVGSNISTSNYSKCNNPTFNASGQNTLLATAAYPTACQKASAPLDCTVKNGKATSASGTTGTPKGSSTAGTGAANTATSGTSQATGNSAIDPNLTGSVVNAGGSGTDRILLAVLTAAGIALAVAAPPTVAALLRRRKTP